VKIAFAVSTNELGCIRLRHVGIDSLAGQDHDAAAVRRDHPLVRSEDLAMYQKICSVVFLSVALLGLLEVASIEAAASDDMPKVRKYAAIIYYGDYTPAEPKGWKSIPEPARSKIAQHLKSRLGEEFYSRLSLIGGQIVDVQTLRRKEPNSKNYKWEVPAYVLHLRFRLPELGIEHYDAEIHCRSDGSVLQEIDLPVVAKHPERGRFISTSKACEIAKKQGFDLAKAEVKIDYRPNRDVCVFCFEQMIKQDGSRLLFKCLDIDAHCGRIIKIYSTEAIE
jgi:hypothetical protein